jgi:hypothetical protein
MFRIFQIFREAWLAYEFFLGWYQTIILLISASLVPGSTGVSSQQVVEFISLDRYNILLESNTMSVLVIMILFLYKLNW